MKPRLLIIDDEENIREHLAKVLSRKGYSVLKASSGEEGLQVFRRHSPEVVILDMRLPGIDGMEVLKKIKETRETAYVIIITAYGDIKSAVSALKEGAHDYLTKPFKLAELLNLLEKIEHTLELEREIVILRQQAKQFRYGDLKSNNPEFQKVLEMIEIVAMSHATILIMGETGTGKELVARAIHAKSPRKKNPFVPVNCTVLKEQLLESELFGHEKGAFTGAHSTKKGLLEYGNGGTIFLDEIGDMAPELQSKLLRFLEERSFRRLGGNRQIEVDVRILAATHQELKKNISLGTFRQDLYFRIMVVPIDLPPLRRRQEDILNLARRFLRESCLELGKEPKEIGPDAAQELLAYSWPGNIRELKNMMERMALVEKDLVLRPTNLPIEITYAEPRTIKKTGVARAKSYRAAKDETMLRFQKEYFLALLRETGGNISESARRAGINRGHLQRLLASMEIDAKDYRRSG